MEVERSKKFLASLLFKFSYRTGAVSVSSLGAALAPFDSRLRNARDDLNNKLIKKGRVEAKKVGFCSAGLNPALQNPTFLIHCRLL